MLQYLESILSKIFSNPAMAGLLSVLGILFSVWGMYRALRGRRLSYRRIDIQNSQMYTVDNGGIQLNGASMGKIAIAEIAVWNSGRKYINCSDMARKEPLRIVAQNDSKIIVGGILFSSCEYCDVNCVINKNQQEILIGFDYLERGEGCIITVIYEGNKEDIRVLGVIKGKGQIKKSKSIMELFKKNKVIYDILTSKICSWIVIFFCFFMCPVAYLQSGNFWALENNFFNIPNTLGGNIFDISLMIILVLFSFGVSIPFWIRLFTPRFPKDLEAHFGK